MDTAVQGKGCPWLPTQGTPETGWLWLAQIRGWSRKMSRAGWPKRMSHMAEAWWGFYKGSCPGLQATCAPLVQPYQSPFRRSLSCNLRASNVGLRPSAPAWGWGLGRLRHQHRATPLVARSVPSTWMVMLSISGGAEKVVVLSVRTLRVTSP
jgi:hypothetical protein